MAGAFGFQAAHYDMSLACGERVLLPKVRDAKPETIVVADGFSCREQIMQTTSRRALHPAEVMKMALTTAGTLVTMPTRNLDSCRMLRRVNGRSSCEGMPF